MITEKHFMQLTQLKLRAIQERILLEMQQVALTQERSNIILQLLVAQSQKKPVGGGRSGAEAKLCQVIDSKIKSSYNIQYYRRVPIKDVFKLTQLNLRDRSQ